MKKNLFLFIFLLLIPLSIKALTYPSLNSKKVEVYDMTEDKILYELKSSDKTSIASLTKIATTITAIENIKNLDEKVTITNKILKTVSWEASRAGLKAGDKLTYLDLLYASMLPSGADATNSIAILSSGSIDNFVKKMNELAKKLDLKNTHFVNVTGLDEDNHYSTVDDIRKLLVYSLKNPLFKQIYSTKKYTLSTGLTVKSTLIGTYKTNINTDRILGSKTGHTANAGYCLSSLSNSNNHEIIIIVINAKKTNKEYYNIIDTLKLINFIDKNYEDRLLIDKDSIIKEIPVLLSKIDSYKIKNNIKITKYLPSDYNKDNFKVEYTGIYELSYKNKKDDKIGTISYYYEDELITKEDVILSINIHLDILKVIKKYYYIIIGIILLIILPIFIKIKNNKKKKVLKHI